MDGGFKRIIEANTNTIYCLLYETVKKSTGGQWIAPCGLGVAWVMGNSVMGFNCNA